MKARREFRPSATDELESRIVLDSGQSVRSAIFEAMAPRPQKQVQAKAARPTPIRTAKSQIDEIFEGFAEQYRTARSDFVRTLTALPNDTARAEAEARVARDELARATTRASETADASMAADAALLAAYAALIRANAAVGDADLRLAAATDATRVAALTAKINADASAAIATAEAVAKATLASTAQAMARTAEADRVAAEAASETADRAAAAAKVAADGAGVARNGFMLFTRQSTNLLAQDLSRVLLRVAAAPGASKKDDGRSTGLAGALPGVMARKINGTGDDAPNSLAASLLKSIPPVPSTPAVISLYSDAQDRAIVSARSAVRNTVTTLKILREGDSHR